MLGDSNNGLPVGEPMTGIESTAPQTLFSLISRVAASCELPSGIDRSEITQQIGNLPSLCPIVLNNIGFGNKVISSSVLASIVESLTQAVDLQRQGDDAKDKKGKRRECSRVDLQILHDIFVNIMSEVMAQLIGEFGFEVQNDQAPQQPAAPGPYPLFFIDEKSNKIFFAEDAVPGDNSCGFHALGVERKDFVQVLLALKDNEETRKDLAYEILPLLLSGVIFPEHERVASALDSRMKQQGECDELMRTLKAQYEAEAGSELKMDVDQFLQFLNVRRNKIPREPRDEENYQKLNAARLVVFQWDEELRIYCTRQKVFECYINLYLGTQWLGIRSAMWWAASQNIRLYVLRRKENSSAELVCDEGCKYTPTCEAKSTIFMLHTGLFTHFNKLSVTDPNLKLVPQNSAVSTTPTLPSAVPSCTSDNTRNLVLGCGLDERDAEDLVWKLNGKGAPGLGLFGGFDEGCSALDQIHREMGRFAAGFDCGEEASKAVPAGSCEAGWAATADAPCDAACAQDSYCKTLHDLILQSAEMVFPGAGNVALRKGSVAFILGKISELAEFSPFLDQVVTMENAGEIVSIKTFLLSVTKSLRGREDIDERMLTAVERIVMNIADPSNPKVPSVMKWI